MEVVYIVCALCICVVIIVGMFRGYNCTIKSRWVQLDAKKAKNDGHKATRGAVHP